MEKKLYRSSNKQFAGVCAGIAEYFNLDPILVRLLFVLFCIAGGSGLLFYIVAAILMPEKPTYIDEDKYTDRKVDIPNDDSEQ